MKASGKGLEIDIALTPEEIDLLGREELSCKADLWDHQDRRRDVPLVLSSKITSAMQCCIKTTGCYYSTEGLQYIPYSAKVSFHLGNDMYHELLSRRFTVSRFNTGGKIKIFDVTRRDEVYR